MEGYEPASEAGSNPRNGIRKVELMTVGELKALLEDLPPDVDDLEIRLMTQESWPFENEIKGMCLGSELPEARDGIVFIVEGEQLGYGTQDAWKLV
ncbi:hypothetical protein ACFLXE_00020 [Chloroflexota bacterium]